MQLPTETADTESRRMVVSEKCGQLFRFTRRHAVAPVARHKRLAGCPGVKPCPVVALPCIVLRARGAVVVDAMGKSFLTAQGRRWESFFPSDFYGDVTPTLRQRRIQRAAATTVFLRRKQ